MSDIAVQRDGSPMQKSQLLAILFMVISMISYQISASFAKQLISVLDPLTVVTLRLCFASIMIFLMFRSWKIIKRLRLLKWHDLLCYSLAVCLMNALFYASLGKLPQGIAVGLEFLGPLTLALLSIQNRTDYIWVGLAILGVALMVPWQDTAHIEFSFVGAALAIGAGICWAFYIYFGQKVVRQNIGLHALTIAIVFSALVMLCVSSTQHPSHLMALEYWPLAILIALLATVIPYALDLLALKQLSKISYGILSSLSPALGALAGWLLLKEQITGLQMLALLCIMLASAGVTYRASKSPDRPAQASN